MTNSSSSSHTPRVNPYAVGLTMAMMSVGVGALAPLAERFQGVARPALIAPQPFQAPPPDDDPPMREPLGWTSMYPSGSTSVTRMESSLLRRL